MATTAQTPERAPRKPALRLKEINEYLETQRGVKIVQPIKKIEGFWHTSAELPDGRKIELKKRSGKLTLENDANVRFKSLDEFKAFYKEFKTQGKE